MKICCSKDCSKPRRYKSASYCIDHGRAYERNWKSNTPVGIQKNRTDAIKHLYGMEYSEYKELLKKKCEVCGLWKPPHLNGKFMRSQMHVDHDHLTGKIRGVLCNTCNVSLGGFKDSVNLLGNAIKYLDKYANIEASAGANEAQDD